LRNLLESRGFFGFFLVSRVRPHCFMTTSEPLRSGSMPPPDTGGFGHYLDLISYKAYADLKAEASRTYINYLWWVLDPLMSLMVYYVVIGLLFQRGGPGFIFVLLVGIIFWRWYSESISHGASTI